MRCKASKNTELHTRTNRECNSLLEIMYPNSFSFVQQSQPKLCGFEDMPVPSVKMIENEHFLGISRNLADSRKKDKNNKVSTRHAHFCSAPHSKFAQFSERNFALFWKNVEISGCNRFAEFRFESNIFYRDFQNFCWNYYCGKLMVNQFELPM